MSRYRVVKQVIKNVVDACPPKWRENITVFDNASTYLGAGELLDAFHNVVRADHNVGYWTAIDWWLDSLADQPPAYTYIIESDMMHYRAWELDECVRFLDKNPHLGSMRLHEYSIKDAALYNKDVPRHDSRRNLWQSHINKVTGTPVTHHHDIDGPHWRTNFLTQLPALNRYDAMVRCFDNLHARQSFIEPDFQALYHEQYPEISIHDGGIFNCDLNPYGTPDTVTGSWTDPQTLQKLGYHGTRHASIVPRDQYKVTRLS